MALLGARMGETLWVENIEEVYVVVKHYARNEHALLIRLAKLGQALADDDPVLAQQATQPIGLGCPLLHQATAHPVQGQDILLLGGLHRHEAHIGTPDGFADRLSIVGLFLFPFT